MAAMSVMSHEAREWNIEDLEKLPDDGQRYEIIDGALIVSPSPIPIHQRVIRNLMKVLDAACPSELEVYLSPLDYQPSRHISVQPDLLIVRTGDPDEKNLKVAPLLAVEVLSASSRRRDLILKRSVYQECGVASYWIFDPGEPSLQAWSLRNDFYVEAGYASGEQSLKVTKPYPVSITPASMVRR